jgi:hypothetical protein
MQFAELVLDGLDVLLTAIGIIAAWWIGTRGDPPDPPSSTCRPTEHNTHSDPNEVVPPA